MVPILMQLGFKLCHSFTTLPFVASARAIFDFGVLHDEVVATMGADRTKRTRGDIDKSE
jgi:hypothetical protein